MDRIRNLLILRGGALGDFILTLPVVSALHRHLPAITIDLASDPRFAELAIGSGWVRKVHSLDAALMAQMYVPDEARNPALADSWRGYDAALCYLEDPDQTIAHTLDDAGIRRRVFVSPRKICGHAIDHFMGGLCSLGLEMIADDSLVLNLQPKGTRSALTVRVSPQRPFFVIHPGSGSARKNWPLDRFVRLAERIRNERALLPVFLLGEAEAGFENILKKTLPSALCLTELGLSDVAAVLKQAQFYVGNDSGITHLSASLGVPTWALFGPTDPEQWAPRGRQVYVVRTHEPGLHPIERLAEDAVWQSLKMGDGGPRP